MEREGEIRAEREAIEREQRQTYPSHLYESFKEAVFISRHKICGALTRRRIKRRFTTTLIAADSLQ